MCSSRIRSGMSTPRGRGFSLVELMVVIVILGLLAGTVTICARGYLIRAKQSAARHEIRTIVGALESFYTAQNRYPTNDEGLEILARPTDKLPAALLTAVPTDPWGRPYQYNAPGTKGPYEVVCYGRDGRDGGEGADADISSDHLKE